MKKNKKICYIFASLIFCGIFCFVIINILLKDKKTVVTEGTIGSIAYDLQPNGDYKVYIREEGKYVPYLVLDYNYNNTGDTLLLREKIVGGQDSYIDESKNFNLEKTVYSTQIEMKGYTNYDKTDVDKYLTEEFYKKFDRELLKNIIYTELEITNNENPQGKNYKIKRQFFLLSLTELGLSKTWDNKSSNNDVLKYFDSSKRVAQNEASVDVIWWTRSYCWGSFCAVIRDGSFITESSTGVKYGVRPAFTISSDTDIKQEYNAELNKIINIIDY